MRQVGVGGEFQSNEDSRVAAVQAECSAGAEEDTGSGSQSLEELVEVEVEVEPGEPAWCGCRDLRQAQPHNGSSQLSTDLLQPAPARPAPHLPGPTFTLADDTTISPSL